MQTITSFIFSCLNKEKDSFSSADEIAIISDVIIGSVALY